MNPSNSAPSGLALERFEQILTGEDRVLLRVLGRYTSTPGESALDAVLIADDGAIVHRHDPLPDLRAGDRSEFWRVGYDVALDLLEDRRIAFAIETGEGILLDLPHPEEHYLTPVMHAAPGFTTRKARRHLALVAGMLAAASVPMGIPAIAITQNEPSDEPQKEQIAASDSSGTMAADAAIPADAAAAAQQAQAAHDAAQPAPAATEQPAAEQPATTEPQPTAIQQTEAVTEAPTKDPRPDEGEDGDLSGDEKAGDVHADDEDDEKPAREESPSVDAGADREVDEDGKSTRSNNSSNHTGNHTGSNPIRTPGGAPTRANPGFFDALPGPADVQGVPNFVIRKFRVPVFLLPIYQSAGIQYGVRWEYLAAINEIETDYGRNLNVSSAGALGWMQFMPATWKAYGVDGNKDGKKDPYNPVDAIFASARYLKAAGAPGDMRKAIFAYNHADWYVDSVMLRAKLIAGIPGDLVGSLTGLTEGRFPVAARARYADDISERDAIKRVKKGQNAANVIDSDDTRRGIDIFAEEDSPVVAVADGVVKKIGKDKNGERVVVIQDVYGNRYTYRGLGSVAKWHPVPKGEDKDRATIAEHDDSSKKKDPKPTRAASAGTQAETPATKETGKKRVAANASSESSDTARSSGAPAVKQRLFAHPARPAARRNGGEEQLWAAGAGESGDWETYRTYGASTLGMNAKNARLKRLKTGSRVIASTKIGEIGNSTKTEDAHVRFEIRPAGRGAPSIDPKPILDGWKLLESTAVYRAKGRNVLYGDNDGYTIGQLLLLSKPLLQKRVLSDERIEVYPSGREDIRAGQIDRRVLATLAYLAEAGLRPTVTSLKSGHGFYTASGNVSHHSSGNAVDIAKINGIPIMGHQERGGVTEQAVRRLMMLQGTMAPDQIISLLDLGQNTVAMGDHDDHIHVGFRPRFGENKKLGSQAAAVLKPGQWDDLIARLGEIENPVVPTKPSKYSIDVRGSDAHKGE